LYTAQKATVTMRRQKTWTWLLACYSFTVCSLQ